MSPPRPLSLVTAALRGRASPLDGVVDRLRRTLARDLRRLAGDAATLTAERLPDIRLGPYLAQADAAAPLAVVRLAPAAAAGLLVAAAGLAGCVTTLLLGGRPAAPQGWTALQRSLLERLFRLVLAALGEALRPTVMVEPRLERLESVARFLDLAPTAGGAMLVRLDLQLGSAGGSLDIVLPHLLLEQLGGDLTGRQLGEDGSNGAWRRHLGRELLASRVRLEVVLDEPTLPLAELAGWQAGSLLPLGVTPASSVTVRAGRQKLFLGAMGRREDRVVVRLEQMLAS